MKRAVVFAVVAVAVVVALAGPAEAKRKTVAYKLAAIDAGAPPDAATVREYQVPLRSLDRKCSDNKTRLGDYTVESQKLLRQDTGADYSLLEILTSVDASIPAGFPVQPCDSIFAAFVTLTEGG